MKKWFVSFAVILGIVAAAVSFWQTREKVPVYLAVETPPAPALTPVEALAGFTLAPGFSVELVAAEPLVVDPVAMAWDESGRLFVVEMRGFMPDTEGTGEDKPIGRVVMLLDENGDGQMDRSEVFLDGLVLPRAVAVVNEGLLVGEPPNLWLCPDIQGKSRCENKRKVADYATDYERVSMEHLENGLMQGLDNWLYNAKSERRFRFFNGELQVEKTLARGQWGISQDNQGRLYYNTNSNFLTGDYFPGHSLNGVSAGLGEQISIDDEVFSIRVNTGVNRAYLDGVLRDDGRLKAPTAVSGLAVYRGGQFPSDYWQDIFVPEPAANAIVQLRAGLNEFSVKAEHVTYPDRHWGQREFFASTDERFRPVDLKVGPDGALYVIDMYRGIIQHKAFLTDELKAQIKARGLEKPLGQGRIWRITHTESPQLKAPNLALASVEQRIAALGHSTPWVRDTAQRLLGADANAVQPLKMLVADASNQLAVVHALWALEAQQVLDADTVVKAIERKQNIVTRQALRAGGRLLDIDQLLGLSAEDLGDTASALAWLNALTSHNQHMAVQHRLLQQLQAHGQDVFRREAVVRASAGVELAILEQLLSLALTQTAANQAALRDLVAGAYMSQRAAAAGQGTDKLIALLAQINAQREDKQWRQIAMLEGLKKAARSFDEPLMLDQAPALFTDKSLAGDDPLWLARIDARRAFTWEGDEMAGGKAPLTGEQVALLEKGKAFYSHCASCHGDKGQGVAGLAPELAGSQWVTGPVEWLTRIVLDGMQGEIEVNGKIWNGVMPGHRQFPGLDAETLTGLLIHLRRLGSNAADAPTIAQVSEILSLPARNSPWTAKSIREVPYASPLDKYLGKYKISFITFTFSIQDGQLVAAAPMYGDTVLKNIGEHRFMADQGGEALEFRFEVDKQGNVDALYIVRGGAENRVEKVK